MKPTKITAFILTILFSIGTSHATSQMQDFSPLAVVNDQPITAFDVYKRLTLLTSISGKTPDQSLLPTIKGQILRNLVEEAVQKTEFSKYPTLDIPKPEMKKAEERFLQQNNLQLDSLKQRLAGKPVTIDDFTDFLRTQMKWNDLTTGKFSAQVHVNRSEVERILERILANSGEEAQVQVFERPVEQVQDLQKTAETLRVFAEKLQSGTSFEDLSGQMKQQGDMILVQPSWVAVGQLHEDPNVLQAIKTAPDGAILGPIKTGNGIAIFRITGHRTGDFKASSMAIDYKKAVFPIPHEASVEQLSQLQAKLLQIKAETENCDDFTDAVEDHDAKLTEHNDVSASAIAAEDKGVTDLNVNEISPPQREDESFALYMVCRKQKDPFLLEHNEQLADQIKRKLFSEKMNSFARNYMRDLKRKATIKVLQSSL